MNIKTKKIIYISIAVLLSAAIIIGIIIMISGQTAVDKAAAQSSSYNVSEKTTETVNSFSAISTEEVSETVDAEFTTENKVDNTDFATSWESAYIEQIVREYLNKPTGEIMASELDDITKLEILANTYYEINGDGLYRKYNIISWDNSNDDSLILNFKDKSNTNIPYGEIRNLNDIRNFRNLSLLNISMNKLTDIDALSNLKNLTDLELNGDGLSDISAVSEAKNIINLSMTDNNINDISAVTSLKGLGSLYLKNNIITDISMLDDLNYLYYLGLGDNLITDVSPLVNVSSLRNLDLTNNDISDISPLYSLTSLDRLYISFNPIEDSAIDSLKANLTDCKIIY